MQTKMVFKRMGGTFHLLAPAMSTGGVKGFMSWRRLADEVLREASEIKADEVVIAFDVDEQGIAYTVQSNDAADAQS